MRRELVLSLLTAVFLAFAFPPFQLGFLAYWTLVPFFYLLEDKSIKESFRWGYVTGLFMSLATVYWISFVTMPGAVATILVHPLYYALYAMLHVFLRDRLGERFVLAIPFVWTGIEYVKSLSELAFPWITLGYTQSYYVSMIQYASYTSVFGVSFWVVCLNVLVYLILKNLENRRKAVVLLGVTSALVVLPWVYGQQVVPDEDEFQEGLYVSVVQGNIDPFIKWEEGNEDLSFEVYERLSRATATEKPDLIVWPETASPKFLLLDRRYLTRVRRLAREVNVPIITGTPDAERVSRNEYKAFNSVIMIAPSTYEVPKYAKMQLVPFGERVPYEDSVPFFRDFVNSLEMGEGNFSPGEEVVVFDVPVDSALTTDGVNDVARRSDSATIPVAAVICFESIFPDLVRKFVQKGARMLVVITNDAWFGRAHFPWWLNAGLYQHARMSVFRAVENRIGVARSANTGVSMFIDPYGRVLDASQLFKETYLLAHVPLRQETTFFARHGNVFTKVVSAVGLLICLAALFPRRESRGGSL